MKLNRDAFKYAKQLINDGDYVLDSNWSEAQPSADDENKFLRKNGWDEYGKWYLGIDPDENIQTKRHYTFPYGDLKKLHRDGLIAAKGRAAQNGYTRIEQAADDLLEMINEHEGLMA